MEEYMNTAAWGRFISNILQSWIIFRSIPTTCNIYFKDVIKEFCFFACLFCCFGWLFCFLSKKIVMQFFKYSNYVSRFLDPCLSDRNMQWSCNIIYSHWESKKPSWGNHITAFQPIDCYIKVTIPSSSAYMVQSLCYAAHGSGIYQYLWMSFLWKIQTGKSAFSI